MPLVLSAVLSAYHTTNTCHRHSESTPIGRLLPTKVTVYKRRQKSRRNPSTNCPSTMKPVTVSGGTRWRKEKKEEKEACQLARLHGGQEGSQAEEDQEIQIRRAVSSKPLQHASD